MMCVIQILASLVRATTLMILVVGSAAHAIQVSRVPTAIYCKVSIQVTRVPTPIYCKVGIQVTRVSTLRSTARLVSRLHGYLLCDLLQGWYPGYTGIYSAIYCKVDNLLRKHLN
jgi:hypothetical protein